MFSVFSESRYEFRNSFKGRHCKWISIPIRRFGNSLHNWYWVLRKLYSHLMSLLVVNLANNQGILIEKMGFFGLLF